jgi:hypothetical protein
MRGPYLCLASCVLFSALSACAPPGNIAKPDFPIGADQQPVPVKGHCVFEFDFVLDAGVPEPNWDHFGDEIYDGWRPIMLAADETRLQVSASIEHSPTWRGAQLIVHEECGSLDVTQNAFVRNAADVVRRVASAYGVGIKEAVPTSEVPFLRPN